MPMSSPQMTRMLGFFCCAWTASGRDRRVAVTSARIVLGMPCMPLHDARPLPPSSGGRAALGAREVRGAGGASAPIRLCAQRDAPFRPRNVGASGIGRRSPQPASLRRRAAGSLLVVVQEPPGPAAKQPVPPSGQSTTYVFRLPQPSTRSCTRREQPASPPRPRHLRLHGLLGKDRALGVRAIEVEP